MLDDECTSNMELKGRSASNSEAAVFTQASIATWVLTSFSGVFLAARLWCRHRFSKPWWDDALLVLSWVSQTLDVYDMRSWTLTGLNSSSCSARLRC